MKQQAPRGTKASAKWEKQRLGVMPKDVRTDTPPPPISGHAGEKGPCRQVTGTVRSFRAHGSLASWRVRPVVMVTPLVRGLETEPCRGNELKPVAHTLSLQRQEAVTRK